jgi:hypothetical protein
LIHVCCFRIYLTCFSFIHYKINNKFSDIVINKLSKLYNITCACVLLLNYILSNITIILFYFKPYLLCTTLILIDSNIINKALYNTQKKKVMKVKINVQNNMCV